MNFADYAQTPLLPLSKSEEDTWTVDDAMKGVSIMGGTGSGKTSASGRTLAMKYLREGWGGVVLCAKTDEAGLWKQYCEDAGRSADFVRFKKGAIIEDKDSPYDGKEMVFNPLDYEMKREGEGAGDTQNITNIFMNIYRLGNRISGEGDTKEERFWDTALKRCLNRSIDLIKLAGEDLTYRNMVRLLSTSNEVNIDKLGQAVIDTIEGNGQQYRSDDHYCLSCLIKAYFRIRNEPAYTENSNKHDMVVEYFTYSLNSLGEHVKPAVVESFMGLAEPFLSGILCRHFSGATTLHPELTYTKQKIIVLDFSIKEYLDAGIIGQCVFKLMFQQAIERRNVKEYPIPVFLWADEAQYFINAYDQIFLTTARSSRTSTVYLSQNISNYLAVMDPHGDGKSKVNSLMGNLSTKIFHANSDAETNEYASKLIGEDVRIMTDMGMEHDHLALKRSVSQNHSSSYLPQVQPKDFSILKTGGIANNYKVQAYITVAGREWANKKNYLKATFTQNFKQ